MRSVLALVLLVTLYAFADAATVHRSKPREGRPVILVVRGDKVVGLPVRLGAADGARVQVVQGLGPADQIIVQGRELARDGQTVKAVPAKTY